MNPPQNEAPSIMDNPFFHRGPIRDRTYFFGRTRETRRALRMLRNGQCISIVGPRRIGKTSLLFHLCDPKVQQEYGLGEEYLFVYIDCQGLGDLDKQQFCQWLWQETNRVLTERANENANTQTTDEASVEHATEPELRARLRQILVKRFDDGELRTLCFDLGIDYDNLPGDGKANKARELVAYLERHGRIPELAGIGKHVRLDIAWGGRLQTDNWTDSLSSSSGFRDVIIGVWEKGYRPVFLFDEFDTIALNPNLDQDLFSNLRSLVPTVVYATASQESLYDLTYADKSVLSSPFFNVFSEIRLGFLKPAEAKEMIRGLLRMAGRENLFTEQDLDVVFELGGYWPFFLQLACYHLFERKMKYRDLTEADYRSLRQDFAEDAKAHFHYAWRRLNVKERGAVRLVCEGKLNQLDNKQRRRLDRECILYNNEIFSSVFAEFEPERITRFTSEDYLRAADRLGEDIERLGRKEARLDFSISDRRLRQAIRLEEEAIIELDDLARRYLGSSFFEYALEPKE